MRVIIVDDHVVFRNGIRFILGAIPGCEVIGDAGTAREALPLIEAERPDVIVLDLALPDMNGVVATGEIRRRSPQTQVLILSLHDQIQHVLDALEAGARGYSLKSESSDHLVGAVRTVARGARYLAPEVEARLAVYLGRRRPIGRTLDVLSEREREVFCLAAQCLTAREVAARLLVSRKTVDTHLYRIHRKLCLRSSGELIRLAAELGLLGRATENGTNIIREREVR